MITLESVTRTYGHFTAFDDVSFTARPGRVTGVIWLVVPLAVGLRAVVRAEVE